MPQRDLDSILVYRPRDGDSQRGWAGHRVPLPACITSFWPRGADAPYQLAPHYAAFVAFQRDGGLEVRGVRLLRCHADYIDQGAGKLMAHGRSSSTGYPADSTLRDELHRLLWQPLETPTRKFEKIILCPPRSLRELPWEAILSSPDRSPVWPNRQIILADSPQYLVADLPERSPTSQP